MTGPYRDAANDLRHIIQNMERNIHEAMAAFTFEAETVSDALQDFADAATAILEPIREAVTLMQAIDAAGFDVDIGLLPFPPTRWQRIRARAKYFFWIESDTDWIIVHVYC